MATSTGGSRLEKLIGLLETGSSPATRRAAAEQIAAIVASHPSQLPFIIRQVQQRLRSSKWDSRTAAGECLSQIAAHCQHHSAADLQAAASAAGASTQDDVDDGDQKADASLLSFQGFSIDKVLQHGTLLLASGGKEYDVKESADPKERLAQQRRRLHKRLGLEGQMEALLDSKDLVKDEDLIVTGGGGGAAAQQGTKQAAELLGEMEGLSAREKARLRRLAKKRPADGGAQKGSSKKQQAGGGTDASAEARRLTAGLRLPDAAGAAAHAAAADQADWEAVEAGQWPFQRVADELCADLLESAWERRHGAAVGLRAILGSHAGAACVTAPFSLVPSGWLAAEGEGKPRLAPVTPEAAAAAAAANSGWLEDCIIRVVCVLALDRFADFVSDQVVAPVWETAAQALGMAVVAPVRETAAQALGAAVQPLAVPPLAALLAMLRRLAGSGQWEARHSGLLALKYVVAARADAAAALLPHALAIAQTGLQDQDDDVRAVAASALLPLAPVLASDRPQQLAQLQASLWNILLDSDELSPATGTTMQLLAATANAAQGGDSLAVLLPRLFPYFRHTLASVRRSCVQCLSALLKADPEGAAKWPAEVLSSALRLAFQNLLQEEDGATVDASEHLWQTLLQQMLPAALSQALPEQTVQALFQLACTPEGQPLDAALLLLVPPPRLQPRGGDGGSTGRQKSSGSSKSTGSGDRDASPFVVGSTHDRSAIQLRAAGGKALGQLAAALQSHAEIQRRLCTASAHDRIVASITASACATACHEAQQQAPLPAAVSERILALLQTATPSAPRPGSSEPYSEVAPLYQRVRGQLAALLQQCQQHGIAAPAVQPAALSLGELAAALEVIPDASAIASAKQALAATLGHLAASEVFLAASVSGCLAGTAVAGGTLPPKYNTIVQPLMGCLRKEAEPVLRSGAAAALARLLQLAAGRTPCPNDRIVNNICSMACADPAETPSASQPDPPLDAEDAEEAAPRQESEAAAPADPAAEAAAIARMGAEAALHAIARLFGGKMLAAVPRAWVQASAALLQRPPEAPLDSPPTADPQAVINALQVLKVLGPALHVSLAPAVVVLLPSIGGAACHTRAPVRAAAVSAAAALAASDPAGMLPPLLRFVVPMLRSDASNPARHSGVQLVSRLTAQLAERLVPYLQLLVVPLMGRMSDALPLVRRLAAPTFATIVSLVPLAQGVAMPAGLDEAQCAAWSRDAAFLAQLQDASSAADVPLPAALREDLQMRPYQLEGYAWLAFLRRSGLHGVLADDMGLGKTLQATAIIAAAVEERRAGRQAHLPSLVVCPSSLVGHWEHEVSKFVRTGSLQPLAYMGQAAARAALQPGARNADIVIMSYETVRGDAAWATSQPWLYAVLDEGHTIRNTKSKIAQACRAVVAAHRLILSGTPIQNSIGELWGLFDWLMPGFLGSEKAFQARHGRALQAARTSKRGSREAEAALLSLEALHKQIKPFVLRRTKDQVLSDLPPKILQDVYVDASPLQARLLADFSGSALSSQITGALSGGCGSGDVAAAASTAPHVFQALQYMRKLCSHPALVLDVGNAAHAAALEAAAPGETLPLRGLQHAPKLAALRELLAQCGIGATPEGAGGAGGEEAGGEAPAHRVLVFAQLRALLDLVETEVLAPNGITWRRLDGSVKPEHRFAVVQQFNADPTIDVMLLTTAVGGLGLNLTAADTVIFLEHDWNPQNDLQAMDRAHRLGQRRTVNVYRLLLRGSVEEHIMGLQRFKLDVAGAIVNADNATMAAMDTARLLDLFAPGQEGAAAAPGATGDASKKAPAAAAGQAAVLQGLGELWDESQYAEEFSLDGFVGKLGGPQGKS